MDVNVTQSNEAVNNVENANVKLPGQWVRSWARFIDLYLPLIIIGVIAFIFSEFGEVGRGGN